MWFYASKVVFRWIFDYFSICILKLRLFFLFILKFIVIFPVCFQIYGYFSGWFINLRVLFQFVLKFPVKFSVCFQINAYFFSSFSNLRIFFQITFKFMFFFQFILKLTVTFPIYFQIFVYFKVFWIFPLMFSSKFYQIKKKPHDLQIIEPFT